MTENSTEKTTVDVAAKEAAAKDEFALATAVAAAGFPGKLPTAAIEAARTAVQASRLQASAAENVLAEAAAKAAGATGIAGHARSRVAVQFQASGDVVQAAVAAAGPSVSLVRSLVWYLVTLTAAEAEIAGSSAPTVEADKPAGRSRKTA